jgi:very-short-patch-repair endonuclease
MTDAEKKLWRQIRADQLEGHRFRKQVPAKPYILDSCCLRKKLVVELDGGQHADSSSDNVRTAWLKRQGYHVLRFWNNDALTNTEGVLIRILEALNRLPDRF